VALLAENQHQQVSSAVTTVLLHQVLLLALSAIADYSNTNSLCTLTQGCIRSWYAVCILYARHDGMHIAVCTTACLGKSSRLVFKSCQCIYEGLRSKVV